MNDHELADLKRDAERYRALERHAEFGITTRPGGRGFYLMYLHGMIGCEGPPIESFSFAGCVDKIVKQDAAAKPTQSRDMPTLPDSYSAVRGRT